MKNQMTEEKICEITDGKTRNDRWMDRLDDRQDDR